MNKANINIDISEIGKRAKKAFYSLSLLKENKMKENKIKENKIKENKKNSALEAVSKALIKKSNQIIEGNKKDIALALENNMDAALIDRLMLDHKRIEDIASGIEKIIKLEDPIDVILEERYLENGLLLKKVSVGLGVIGIIYEARPNVTVDAFALCFKSGNALILKGGKEAINTNKIIRDVIQEALKAEGLDPYVVQLIENTDRETTKEFMKMNEYVDVLIPRGSASLIQTVIKESTIPVIETGSGNCHIYIDKTADFNMAFEVIKNAKLQRLGVCNAAESLVVHEDIAATFIPELIKAISSVEIYGDKISQNISNIIKPATEADYYAEYLDKKISLKTVTSLDEAIDHINQHGTKHSESIITEDEVSKERFLNEIDAAVVYVNASTRFTDGFEFGLGAELGISTQKLHARGPMGLKELTSYKYIVIGKGQTRA